MLDVVLRPSADGARYAVLRDLTGEDELVVERTLPSTASALVLRLLLDVPGAAVGPATGWALSLCDRDRLIAALHRSHFGSRIESVATCATCSKTFAVSFDLDELVAGTDEPANVPGLVAIHADGSHELADGTRFRLPQALDERVVAGLPADVARARLRERCRLCAGTVTDDELESAIGALCPVLDLALDATCAECGSTQQVDFDMVRYFLASMLRERPLLSGEVHRLASQYHWGFQQILALPRAQRRAQVALIEADRGMFRGMM